MLNRYPLYTLFLSIIACAIASCNSDSTPVEEDTRSLSEAAIISFSLSPDDSILENLDSVFFSIDLTNAEVYNADSLPKGTDVSKLVINIGLQTAAVAEITMPSRFTGTDTVVDYLTSSTDSINFTRGFVKLHVESYNKETKRDYTIRVNVHKMVPDSLYWNQMAMTKLPTQLSSVSAQRTIEYQQQALCFTTDGTSACRAISSNPGDVAWQISSVTLPEGALISSISATKDALFLIDSSDNLYTSTDAGSTWTATGTTMSHIYGGCEDTLLGVRRAADGSYLHVTYPASTETPVAAACPVSGTSNGLTYTTKWSDKPMFMFMGGRTADGTLSGAMWAWDGESWAEISVARIPAAEGMSLIPYSTFRTKNGYAWVTTEQTTLIAMGGKTSNGSLRNTVYISLDRGVHWTDGYTYLQFPDYIPAFVDADALVFSTTMSSRSGSQWKEFPAKRLPAWWGVEQPASRAVTPVTQWECPYIYLFGGNAADGTTYDTLWKGVINRLTFKPLQ